mmetsp:Transcript_60832/g.144966  ORF Transcript_60832/g.144966 Transcript_60832/m.144966 type:complete len:893 (+) Transcript_60832:103-2781(+)
MGSGASSSKKEEMAPVLQKLQELQQTVETVNAKVKTLERKSLTVTSGDQLLSPSQSITAQPSATPIPASPQKGGMPRQISPMAPTKSGRPAPSMEVVEHAPKSVLEGSQIWEVGRFVVLSGSAKVCTGDGDSTVVLAILEEGNEFGWSHYDLLHEHHNPEDEVWLMMNPRIEVGTAGLKVQQSDTDSHVCKSKRHFMSEGRTGRLGSLWLSSTPPVIGIGMQPRAMLRAHFLQDLWGPLVDRLEDHEDEIRRRKRRGYRVHDCFPLQGHQVAELRQFVNHLTEIWYGSSKGGNCSVLYRWFIKAMEALGVMAYSMDVIPVEPSKDTWATVIDGGARASALKGVGGGNAAYVATGGVSQKQGRSAIDNTVLVNVFTPLEAKLMLLGRRVRKAVCRFIAIRQKCILRKLSARLQMNLLGLASEESTGRGHRVVRAVLRSLPQQELDAAGLSTESFCFKEILDRGCMLAGFGQLDPVDQQRVWNFIRISLLPEGADPDNLAPSKDTQDVFEQLVLWCRNRPGEYFEQNKLRHFEVMLAGLWCDKVIVVKRSAMERMTLARYFALSWRRTQPLWALFGKGSPTELRNPGTVEASRVRANECPYMKKHGMSLPAGGIAFDQRRNKAKGKAVEGYSLMMEMQWVQDPSSNIENWFITDIEKIVQEAWQLNPHASAAEMLPGEMFVNVGQNPKIGSSIKQTQHTQLCEGSLKAFPVLTMQSEAGPRFSGRLDAHIDFVDVGPKNCAEESKGFFVKVLASKPASALIIQFLVDLRLHLLANFGGAEVLDFLVSALSDEKGGFVVLFAPIPQMVKLDDAHPDLATWANPLTGESSVTASLEEARLDFAKGVGHFLCMKPALRTQLLGDGEDTLRRIWAFNRVPGLPAAVREFAKSKRIFDD